MNKPIILLEKTYHGFEDFHDYYRDVAEVWDFPQDPLGKKVIGEFKGKIKIRVEFEPEEGDLKP